MRRNLLSWGLMLAATFTLTNCAEEIENPANEPETSGYPFEVIASVETKTVNNGLSTNWVAGDAINLFHAVTDGAEYVNNGKFVITEENLAETKFTGELKSELDPAEEYDWYAFYPYTSQISTPANKSTYVTVGSKTNSVQTQVGNDNMDHIAGPNYPIVGKDYARPGNNTPTINMCHATSLVKVVVKNYTEEPLTVEEIYFVAPERIVGTFYIDFTAPSPLTSAAFVSSGDSYTSNTAKLGVVDAEELAAGESAAYYLAVKPFTAEAGSTLQLYVNGAVKEHELTEDVTFTAGKVKTLNYSFVSAEVAGPEIVTVEDFLAKEVNSAVWYQLTGTIKNIVNTEYGNFDLVDETGSVYVYGLTSEKVASNDKSYSSLGLKAGDVVTLIGTRATYNSTAQVGGPAYYVSHIASCAVPVIDCEDNVVTITSTETNATIYYTINGDDPTTASFVYDEPIELEEGDEFTVKAIVVADGKATSLVVSRPCKWIDPNASVGTPSTTACYTLLTSEPANMGTNNSYAGNCDVDVNGIKWNVTGNAKINPWRIGGKSITKVDRSVYSKTAYADALSKVEFVSGTVNATWNSLTLLYSTNSDFSDAKTLTGSGIGQNKTISFAPEGGFPAGCYFKFVLNVTVSGNNNKYIQLNEIKFYGYEN